MVGFFFSLHRMFFLKNINKKKKSTCWSEEITLLPLLEENAVSPKKNWIEGDVVDLNGYNHHFMLTHIARMCHKLKIAWVKPLGRSLILSPFWLFACTVALSAQFPDS